jgi:ACS family pantothenate transporter-like MFS transporter
MLLPGLEVLWGILTIGTTFVTSTHQLYLIRFLIGFLEGSCFVGIQYVLGSWYKKTEIGKRTAIFVCAAYVGTMFSGYMQSAMIAGMEGKGGLAARYVYCARTVLNYPTDHVRRWVFVFDGIITLVVAVYGFIFFPDTPHKTKAFYLSEGEKARCVERLVEDGRQEETKFSLDLFKRTMNTWQLYVLTVLWWYVPIAQMATPPADPFLVFGTLR